MRRKKRLLNPLRPDAAMTPAFRASNFDDINSLFGVHFSLDRGLAVAYAVRAHDRVPDPLKNEILPIVISANIPKKKWEVDVDGRHMYEELLSSKSMRESYGGDLHDAREATEADYSELAHYGPCDDVFLIAFKIVMADAIWRVPHVVKTQKEWMRYYEEGILGEDRIIEAVRQLRIMESVHWRSISRIEILPPIVSKALPDGGYVEAIEELGWGAVETYRLLTEGPDALDWIRPIKTIKGPAKSANCHHGTILLSARRAFPEKVKFTTEEAIEIAPYNAVRPIVEEACPSEAQ